MHEAPHNEYFWRLHGWIDNRYVKWQETRGEQVDRTPLEPTHHHTELPEKFRPKHGAKFVEVTPALLAFEERLFRGERPWEMQKPAPGLRSPNAPPWLAKPDGPQ